jgi:endoglycosylceramidase
MQTTLRLLVSLALLGAAACAPETAAKPPAPPLRAVKNPGGTGYFVDPAGREVLLRGVNYNAFAEYWAFDPALPSSQPYEESDTDFIAGLGFNFVRLLVTWSRVEPRPGVYDDAYLAQVRAAAADFWARGVYVMVDMHQDGWGPFIAARAGEACAAGEIPAPGWDGAPEWATLVDAATPRCLGNLAGNYVREFNPAAQEAWHNLVVRDAAGPGGVGLQERFAAMWAHLAGAVAGVPGVMGYDVLNEPNTFTKEDHAGLAVLYAKALAAIRDAEDAAGIAHRVFVFEPSGAWSNLPSGDTVDKFTDDPQVAYGPHVYQGSIGLMPLDDGQLARLAAEVKSYGGVPVVVGEWGDWPADLVDPNGYFLRMIGLQDALGWSTAHWNFKSGCGDPHRYYDWYKDKQAGVVWTYENRGCATFETPAWYLETYAPLKRPALAYAPGRIAELRWNAAARAFTAAGPWAPEGNALELFLPGGYADLEVRVAGLTDLASEARHGGRRFTARARGGRWSVTAR